MKAITSLAALSICACMAGAAIAQDQAKPDEHLLAGFESSAEDCGNEPSDNVGRAVDQQNQ